MQSLSQEIQKHIKKLVHPLKEEEELYSALKVKLTKKELKLLKAWAEGEDASTIQEALGLTQEAYEERCAKLIKKLNQERIKQALCI